MRIAVMRIMLLNLWRDRGAFAIGFILPGIVYVIFAGIFAGAAAGDVKIRLAMVDERDTVQSSALLESIRNHPAVIEVSGAHSAASARQLVQSGSADVAAVIRDNGSGFDQLNLEDVEPPVLILFDPFREISVKLLQGVIQEAYFTAIPDANLSMVVGIIEEAFFEFEPEQRILLDEGLEMLRDSDDKLDLGSVYALQSAGGESNIPAGVSYYAGAVAILFLLLSSLNGALSILEDRESGMFDRITMGRGGVASYMQGKHAFLFCQCFLEVVIIFSVAWLLFGVDVPAHFLSWLLITVAAACCASGLSLFFVSCCRSRQQAQSTGNIVVLVISALGGSMVPRFLMPPEVQELGWLTPNTWVLEAYSEVFWRQTNEMALLLPIVLLFASGIVGGCMAIVLQKHRRSQ